MKVKFVNLLLLSVLCFSVVIANGAERKTRDLVFEDEDDVISEEVKQVIPNAELVSMKTTLELKRDDNVSTVLPTHEFKSGDSVKLVYTTNIDGYVYWMAKGTSGSYQVLFPSPKAGLDNKITKNTEYTVPVKGSFKFDDQAGKEELLCILSVERLPDLELAVSEAAGQAITPDAAVKVAAVEKQNITKRTTRDLVFEDEDEEDVNTKTQVAPKGEPFISYFELIHN